MLLLLHLLPALLLLLLLRLLLLHLHLLLLLLLLLLHLHLLLTHLRLLHLLQPHLLLLRLHRADLLCLRSVAEFRLLEAVEKVAATSCGHGSLPGPCTATKDSTIDA